MKAQGKTSRNRQRKVAYAAEADKSSRNEATIGDKPIVGHFEEVWEEVVRDEDGGVVRVKKLDRPYRRIIHDGDAVAKPASVPAQRARASTAKARRQEEAWARCGYFAKNKEHDYTGERHNRKIYRSDRCISCGCPAS